MRVLVPRTNIVKHCIFCRVMLNSRLDWFTSEFGIGVECDERIRHQPLSFHMAAQSAEKHFVLDTMQKKMKHALDKLSCQTDQRH